MNGSFKEFTMPLTSSEASPASGFFEFTAPLVTKATVDRNRDLAVANFTSFVMPHICSVRCKHIYQLDLFDTDANERLAEEASAALARRCGKAMLFPEQLVSVSPMTSK